MNFNPFKQKSSVKPFENNLTLEDVRKRGYLSFAVEFMDNLIKYGTDRYGKVHNDMLVSMLDLETKECPEYPLRCTPFKAPQTHYAPTPYNSNLYVINDYSWGYHGAYMWNAVDSQPADEDGKMTYSFEKVSAKAVAVDIDISKDGPIGIYEIVINDGEVTPKQVSATYAHEGSWSKCSVCTEGNVGSSAATFSIFKNNVAALFDGLYPEKDKDAPLFSFWERELSYDASEYLKPSADGLPPHIKEMTGTDGWIMLEFSGDVDIEKIDIYFEIGSHYKMPQNINVSWANDLDFSKAEYPDWEVLPWRGGKRDCYVNARGSEFYEDQPMMHAFSAASTITGDQKYYDHLRKYFNEVLKISKTDRFMWGTHLYYDVFFDRDNDDGNTPHEFAVKSPAWDELWDLDKDATYKEIEYILLNHIVDNETGEYNRHDVGNPANDSSIEKNPCMVPIAGGLFIYTFCFMYKKTGEQKYLDMAKLVADLWMKSKDEKTGVAPNGPNLPPKEANSSTDYTGNALSGVVCYGLLKSYEVTGDEYFKDSALYHLKNYGKYGYDEENRKFFANVDIRTLKNKSGSRWEKGEFPAGYCELWQPYQYGWEQPLLVAQTYAYAYHLTKDKDMLYYAEKWAVMINENPPEMGCRHDTQDEIYARFFSRMGTYADYYGRCISFFITLYIDTGKKEYLGKAKDFADEAILKLYYKGLFRGHPASTMYHNIDGHGFLMYGLLQLHVIEQKGVDEFSKYIKIDNF